MNRTVPPPPRAVLGALALAVIVGCSSKGPTDPAPSGMYQLTTVGRLALPALVIDTLPDPLPSFQDSLFAGSLDFAVPDTMTIVSMERSWSPTTGWAAARATDTTLVAYSVAPDGAITLMKHFAGSAGQDTVLAIPVVANGATLTFTLPYGVCQNGGGAIGSTPSCITRFKEVVYTR